MRQTDINAVAERMTPAALLEQLAEEAIELAHAAGKYARLIRGESPTNITPEEAHRRVKEEMSDVFLVARVVKAKGFDFDSAQISEEKLQRWRERLGVK